MGPSVGRTSRSTRIVTFTSARRTRSSRRRASWSTTGDTSLSDQSARLSWLPAQGTMLSEDVRPQNPAQYLRGSSRRCPDAGQDGGVQAIIPRQETCRNAVWALEAYPAARALPLPGPCGAHVQVTFEAIAQDLRTLAKWVALPPPVAP